MEGSGQFWRRARRHRLLQVGAACVLLFVGAALLAPVVAPHDPLRQFANGLTEAGAPRPPGGSYFLGTDDFGRDARPLGAGHSNKYPSTSKTETREHALHHHRPLY